nr:glycine betaine ABC transporter substrate-binding protein [Chromobacterium sphagni]
MTSPHLTLITIDLSFHHASAAAVAAMLEKHGVAVSEWRVPHERAFELLASGEGDLLCCAWLPGSHGRYLAPMADEVEKLAVLYTPYALWAVPGYVPAESVAEIADLKKPEVAARMLKKIQGINPGAGISRFSREIIAHYGLEQAGYHFENGSQEDCARAFEKRGGTTRLASGAAVATPVPALAARYPRAGRSRRPVARQGRGDAVDPQSRAGTPARLGRRRAARPAAGQPDPNLAGPSGIAPGPGAAPRRPAMAAAAILMFAGKAQPFPLATIFNKATLFRPIHQPSRHTAQIHRAYGVQPHAPAH